MLEDGLSRNSLCFVANYTKTFYFHAIAQQLLADGFSVSWIVVNDKLRDFLHDHYDNEKVLYLSKRHAETHGKSIGEFKLNELTYGDRALQHSPEEGIRFLLSIQKPIYDFLQARNVRFVFGELTWAHEILIRRIVAQKEELGATYLNMATVRIPDQRFAFFTDEFESQFLPIDKKASDSGAPRSISVKKPAYLALNDAAVKSSRSVAARLARLGRFVSGENIDADDPTLINRRWTRLRVRCKEEINRELYRFVPRVPFDEVRDRKYVFVALHKQPEASIDVIGRYYEDQYTNIVNLWRIVPDDWLVLVKEHTNAIGDRSLRFYMKLTRLPNLRFLQECEDSHEIIRHSELVVTVSGTVAYEAALMGKRAVTLAPTFFGRAPNCCQIGLEDLRSAQDIYDILNRLDNSESDLESYVLDNSFPGLISDPITCPDSTSEENVRLIADAICRITDK